MPHDPRFGPNAQTPQQRANVLRQLQLTHPRLKTKATPFAQHLYARYVAGELSWPDVRRALDEAAT
ncbi:hypothetical protein JAO73_03450 [Hymenobacter sp. BT523]|uniref:hypothetical protein n=1 Tax=Hymenobacter sp. BT523 TaxID=2795725 RepID=UPI0018EB0977|nr:hypothetical protein [Hymenobacter sp. BT523]MBJ6108053.1 hypothetical protein [Hymenobacter sp. BT523]